VGAVLSQVQDGREVVVAYYNKALSASEKNYCTTRRELLAVVKAVNTLDHTCMDARSGQEWIMCL